MSTFTFVPSYGVSVKKAPQVRAMRFGDGYEQRASFGINTMPRMWELSFNGRTQTESEAIESFLSDKKGVDFFTWTPPTGSAGRFVCRAWVLNLVEVDCYNISATFEEVFDT